MYNGYSSMYFENMQQWIACFSYMCFPTSIFILSSSLLFDGFQLVFILCFFSFLSIPKLFCWSRLPFLLIIIIINIIFKLNWIHLQSLTLFWKFLKYFFFYFSFEIFFLLLPANFLHRPSQSAKNKREKKNKNRTHKYIRLCINKIFLFQKNGIQTDLYKLVFAIKALSHNILFLYIFEFNGKLHNPNRINLMLSIFHLSQFNSKLIYNLDVSIQLFSIVIVKRPIRPSYSIN